MDSRYEYTGRHGQLGAVHDVQHRRRHDERGEEPVGHVDVRHAALDHGAEEHDEIRDPHECDEDVDGPLELRVFLAARHAERQRHGGENDDRLPTPERERRERVGEQAHVTRALNDVVRSGEERRAAEREDHCIRMQWP
jgi:hypothetical protein